MSYAVDQQGQVQFGNAVSLGLPQNLALVGIQVSNALSLFYDPSYRYSLISTQTLYRSTIRRCFGSIYHTITCFGPRQATEQAL